MSEEFEKELTEMANAVTNIAATNGEDAPMGKMAGILGAAKTPEAAQVLKMAIDQELAEQKAAYAQVQKNEETIDRIAANPNLSAIQERLSEVTAKDKELFEGSNTVEDMPVVTSGYTEPVVETKEEVPCTATTNTEEGDEVVLTPEDEAIIKEMEDKIGDPEDDAIMEQAKKEAAEHAGEPGYMATATVETDLVTERTKIVTIDDENSGMEPITETFEEYLERHKNDQSLEDIPIDEAAAGKVISDRYTDMSFDDAAKLASILRRWQAKEISTIQAFNEFPQFMTIDFNAQLMRAGVHAKEQVIHKKEYAKAILEDLATSTQLKQASDDVNVQIEKIYKEYGDDVNVLYQAGIFEKINTMKKAADAVAKEQYTDEETRDISIDEWQERQATKIRTMNDIAAALEESFKFEKFAKRIGHIKAKKIDLTDPKRCFSHFNSKYARSKFSGADVSTIVPIIEKHCGFSHEQAVEFAVVFCEYCRNMRPSNIPEHVFMYYSVANINSLAMAVGDKAAQFANGLVGNIKALMAIHEAKGNGEDYVALGLTDEEIDELLKQSTELVKQAEKEAKNEQKATPSEEESSSTHETNEEASAGAQ